MWLSLIYMLHVLSGSLLYSTVHTVYSVYCIIMRQVFFNCLQLSGFLGLFSLLITLMCFDTLYGLPSTPTSASLYHYKLLYSLYTIQSILVHPIYIIRGHLSSVAIWAPYILYIIYNIQYYILYSLYCMPWSFELRGHLSSVAILAQTHTVETYTKK